jgi:hypothetical protein
MARAAGTFMCSCCPHEIAPPCRGPASFFPMCLSVLSGIVRAFAGRLLNKGFG